jgi:hypothetical protein
VIVFLAHIVSWFALMRFAKGAHWTVFNAIGALCMPILLYLISDLVVPRIGDEGRTDLRQYYFANYRWFTGLMIAFVLLGMLVQVAVERQVDWSEGGASHFSIVSALGASRSSPFFYSRVKGEVEQALRGMGWPSLAIFRPSVIAGERGESRPLERVSEHLLRFAPATWRPVAATDIAAAMVAVALACPPGITVLESRDIPSKARGSAATST